MGPAAESKLRWLRLLRFGRNRVMIELHMARWSKFASKENNEERRISPLEVKVVYTKV